MRSDQYPAYQQYRTGSSEICRYISFIHSFIHALLDSYAWLRRRYPPQSDLFATGVLEISATLGIVVLGQHNR